MSRLNKKFLRPDSVDGSKIKLLNGESLRAVDAAGTGTVELLKLNLSNALEFLVLPEVSGQPTTDTQIAPKLYVDTQSAGALQDAKDYSDQKIAALVDSAPEVLNTLKELALALGSDENFATTIAGQIGGLSDRLDVIEGADTVAGSVAKALKDAKDYADGIVGTEETDRAAADDALDGRLDIIEGANTVVGSVAKAEKDAKDYADSIVSTEQIARANADDALDGRLDIIEGADTVAGSVAKAEKDAKAYADTIVGTEASDRSGADSVLSGRLDALELDPVTKSYVDGPFLTYVEGQISALESSSSGALDQEVLDRQAGDDALDGRLDVIEGDNTVAGSVAKSLKDAKDYTDSAVTSLVNGAPALLDTLKEIADALGNDENLAGTISGQISGLDTRIDVIEGADTEAGSVLWAKKQANIYTDDEIAQEVLDRDAAIEAEAQLRSGADDALDGRLDVIEGDDTVVGSVAKALKDAKDYTDEEVALDRGRLDTVEGRATTLEGRADVVEGRATTLEGRADAVEGRATAIEGDVSVLKGSASVAGSVAKAQADAQAYADGLNTTMSGRVSTLEALNFFKEKKTLGAGEVGQGYVDLAFEATANSSFVFISGGGYLYEGDDYTVSLVGSASRLTFIGDYAAGGVTAMEAGDVLCCQYQRNVSGGGGGGGGGGGLTTITSGTPTYGVMGSNANIIWTTENAASYPHVALFEATGMVPMQSFVKVQQLNSSSMGFGVVALSALDPAKTYVAGLQVLESDLYPAYWTGTFQVAEGTGGGGGGGGGSGPTLLLDSPNVTQGGGIVRSTDQPYGEYSYMVGIVAPGMGQLAKIALELKTYQGNVGSGNMFLRIKDGIDGATLATSSAVDVATLNTASPAFVDFLFDGSAPWLMLGQTYAIEPFFMGSGIQVEAARNGSSPNFLGYAWRQTVTGETSPYDGFATNMKVYVV